MTFDWKSVENLVRTVAPTVATALGGPLAGMATQVISTAVLGKPDGTQDELSAALSAATPDMLLKLKQAELGFQARMKELDIDLEKLAAGDRDSARKREIAVRDKTPQYLAAVSFIGFFGVLAMIMFADIPDKAHDALMLMLGALSTMVMGVIQYYFGSSSGSAAKSAMIDKMMQK